MSHFVPYVDGEVIRVQVEPPPPLWLRLAAWWPSAFAAVIGMSLIVGAVRCWA